MIARSMIDRAVAVAAVLLALLAILFCSTGPAEAQAGRNSGTPGGQLSPEVSTTTVTGTFRLLYVDPPPGSSQSFGPPVPVIETATGTVRVDQAQVPAGVEPGDTVSLPSPGGQIEVVGTSDARTVEGASGTHRVLLAMVSWPGNPADSVTAAQASSAVAANRSWYQTASAGRLDMPTLVQNWLPIATPGACDVRSIDSNARSALAALGYNLSTYSSVVLYFAHLDCFSWAGRAESGTVLLNGYINSLLIAHELGHQLGLGHAGALSCTDGNGSPVPLSATCVGIEYGDHTDTMGDERHALFSGPHLAELDWLAPTEVVVDALPTAGTTDRIHELVPLESAGSGTRVVQIATPDGSSYWLENRQPVGIDASVFQPGEEGVRLHFTPRVPCAGSYDFCVSDSYLLDPGAGRPGDTGSKRLEPGVPWTSPDGSVTVTAQAATGNHMAVDLHLNPPTGVAPVVTAVEVGDEQAALTWTAGTGALGLPATGYLVTARYRFAGGGDWSIRRQFPSIELSATFTGLPNGALATFRVAATNAIGAGPVSLSTAEVLIVPPQPDLRLKSGSTLTGDDYYTTTGDSQTSLSAGPAATSFTQIVSVQNDGPRSESIRIKASASSPGLTLQYSSGGIDVTGQVVAGTYLTRSLAPQASQNIKVVARLTTSARRNVWMNRTVTASSTSAPRRKDRVLLQYVRY